MTGRGTGATALLKRIGAHPSPERFRLRDVCPRDATRFDHALEQLVEWGYVERVTERVGVWHYRVTDKGRSVIAGTERVRLGENYVFPARGYEPIHRSARN